MNDFTGVDFAWALGKVAPNRALMFNSSPIKLIGIRGAQDSAVQQNSFARYDDAIVVDIQGKRTQWLASTDPSWALVIHPINPVGAAQLLPGVHLFQRFLMHAGTLRQNWCLGQAESGHVNRLNLDGTVNHVDYGDFGICIHSGGEGMDTGRFSAGCQIIQNNDGYFQNPTWGAFYGPIRDMMVTLKTPTIPYLLINRSDL